MQPFGSGTAGDRSPYLSIRQVTKRFGTFVALNGVSLDIQDGEFLCILGPSGCGKTTLLRIIAGLEVQTQGTILQGGRDVSRLPPGRRDFGIVFQSYALFPNLTVFRNVAYGLKNRGGRRAELQRRVGELLELMGLVEQSDKYPAQLSGGQQQRVALARALATSPGLLLLDEPLSALDAKVRQRLRQELKQLHRRIGVTTVMVTHDQEEALTLGDRIAVMNQSVIEQVGSPMELYRHPVSPFVADFVGTMNFLAGKVLGNGNVGMAGIELEVAEPINAIAAGGDVVVCIRPEDVLVRDVRLGAPNAFEVTIQDMEFLGSFFRVLLQPRQPRAAAFRADFSINLAREVGAEPGKTLPVAFAASRTLVFAGTLNGET